MSLTYGFYNAKQDDLGNFDRTYDAIQMSSIFDGIIMDGVLANVGEHFQLRKGVNPWEVIVGTGRAWFNHTWTLNDGPLVIDCGEPPAGGTRRDAIILEVNASEDVRANRIFHQQGDLGGAPPRLVNNEYVHQYCLGFVQRSAGEQAIAEENIIQRVGMGNADNYGNTPFVTAPLESVSVDYLYENWNVEFNNWAQQQQGDFYAWFSKLEGMLDENSAAALAKQILELRDLWTTFRDESRIYDYLLDANGSYLECDQGPLEFNYYYGKTSDVSEEIFSSNGTVDIIALEDIVRSVVSTYMPMGLRPITTQEIDAIFL